MIRFIAYLFVLCGSLQLAYADKGVFNAHVTPDVLFTNEFSPITVTAEIGVNNAYLSSIFVYQTTAEGKPIAKLAQMTDDGKNGDERAADTVYTARFSLNKTQPEKMYIQVSAAYSGERNRYLSPVLSVGFYNHLPEDSVDTVNQALEDLKNNFQLYLSQNSRIIAAQKTLEDAQQHPAISNAELDDEAISIIFKSGVRGFINLIDPALNTLGSGFASTAQQISLNDDFIKLPGNDLALIYAPYYDRDVNIMADTAKYYLDNSFFMQFYPKPAGIASGSLASLDSVINWGAFGTVFVSTHGNVLRGEVVLCTATKYNQLNKTRYEQDLASGMLTVSPEKDLCFHPSFISAHALPMNNTFFWFGACKALANDSLWNVLKAKGAKVAFGWNQTVSQEFDLSTFEKVFTLMLPESSAAIPYTALQAYTANASATDPRWGAKLQFRTHSYDWNKFVFLKGGLINGDFELSNWTAWKHGGDYNFRLISGSKKHSGNQSAALGRWDSAFHGEDHTAEPKGYEWFYQDFVVPNNATYLKFYWWMETYDTAKWSWFDAFIKDPSTGATLKTILSKAGKPGTNYGPYWTTSGWQEVQTDISAYRGKKIRIYFDQYLDGYGDQQRVYVDDVSLE